MFLRTIRLVNIFGFEVKVDASWLLIAALIMWSLSAGYFPAVAPGLRQQDYLAMSAVSVVAMFACLIAHELAHSLMARRFGLKIGGITLFLFGGVAELENEPQSARSEFWIALAGPVMSLGLALLFSAVQPLLEGAGASAALQAGIGYLALINLVLALFNLIPAFPLDGGRVLRAALWARLGDVTRATRIATRISVAFAFALIGFGFLALSSGNMIGGIWQVMIGFYLLTAAQGSYQQLVLQTALRGQVVADLMTIDPRIAAPTTLLSDLVTQTMLGNAISFVPVVEAGRLIGYIDTGIVRRIDPENWPVTSVGDVYVAVDSDNSVPPDLPAQSLIARMAKTGRRKFLVPSGDRLAGVISLSDLVHLLAVLQDLGLPKSTGAWRGDHAEGAPPG
ncbi:MAG: CBS domain-containing protein [Tabrizicola sp.]|nr:CBS domain-containing protein [Tabrizicola sp.]